MKHLSLSLFAAVIVITALICAAPALAIDTSAEPHNRSELNEFGAWLYSLEMTDLDLVVEHQDDAHATEADSGEVYNTIAKETAMRRILFLQRQLATKQQAGTVLTDSARTVLRIRFCRDDLLALKDSCDLIEIASSKKAAEAYRKMALARIDSTVQRQLAIQAGNTNLDSLAAQFERRGYHFGSSGEASFNPDDYDLVTTNSLLEAINAFETFRDEISARVDNHEERIATIEEWRTEVSSKMERFATMDWCKSSFKAK